MESVYSAVRTDSLYTADYVWSLKSLNKILYELIGHPISKFIKETIRTTFTQIRYSQYTNKQTDFPNGTKMK